jgi:hypothetical protein
MNPKLLVLPLVTAVLTLAGCSPGTGEITGVVKYKNEVLTGGTISFYPDAGGVFNGQIDKDGTYKVANVPAGNAKVSVTGLGNIGPGLPGTPVVTGAKLPDKLGKAESSGLTFDVRPGPQTKDWDLKD